MDFRTATVGVPAFLTRKRFGMAEVSEAFFADFRAITTGPAFFFRDDSEVIGERASTFCR